MEISSTSYKHTRTMVVPQGSGSSPPKTRPESWRYLSHLLGLVHLHRHSNAFPRDDQLSKGEYELLLTDKIHAEHHGKKKILAYLEVCAHVHEHVNSESSMFKLIMPRAYATVLLTVRKHFCLLGSQVFHETTAPETKETLLLVSNKTVTV